VVDGSPQVMLLAFYPDNDSIDEEHGERWKRIIIWYLAWPGVAQWWAQFAIAYTDTFQDYVNELLKGLADGSIPVPDHSGFDVDVTQSLNRLNF